MKDETYAFISDVKEKGSVGRSARARRTHTGKGGRVSLPSDNLSNKELMKMSGECKSYRLNDPMAWKEFKAMPDDIKVTYIKLLRQKFNVPVTQIAKMMGVTEAVVRNELKRLGLTDGKKRSGKIKWDKEGFWAWANRVDKLPTPVPEEPVIEEVSPEDLDEIEKMMAGVKNKHIKPETYTEDDLPFEEPDPVQAEQDIALRDKINALQDLIDELYEVNEELKSIHEKDKHEVEWLRKEHDSLQNTLRMREAQLEIVQLIFGGGNRG